MSTTALAPTLSTLETGGHESTLGLIVALVLLAFLITKDIVVGVPEEYRDRWNGALNIAIVPLGMIFLAIVITSVADVLS